MINNGNCGGYQPLVSFVIPTRNEATDIAGTLDRCLAIDYDRKEVIVVDDSTDETPNVVASYSDRGVRLIHREKNSNGCCGARNLGMQMANGEILILLNADDRPQPDFLRRLLPHYASSADYVILRSVVANVDSVWGKYASTMGFSILRDHPELQEWSEGFSCRREMATKAGYIPGDFPIPFCRDFIFGPALTRIGALKHVDMTIPMEHIVPDTLRSYWRNQVWRGTFVVPYNYYFLKKPVLVIWIREILKLGRTMLKYGLLVPGAWEAVRLTRYAPDGWRWRDGPSFWWVALVQEIAHRVGNFKGLLRLMKVQQSRGA